MYLVGKIEGCFNGVYGGLQGYLKEVQRVFEGRVFQGRYKGVSRDLFCCCMAIITATQAEGGLVFHFDLDCR